MHSDEEYFFLSFATWAEGASGESVFDCSVHVHKKKKTSFGERRY
jgi:hypothetical protein